MEKETLNRYRGKIEIAKYDKKIIIFIFRLIMQQFKNALLLLSYAAEEYKGLLSRNLSLILFQKKVQLHTIFKFGQKELNLALPTNLPEADSYVSDS